MKQRREQSNGHQEHQQKLSPHRRKTVRKGDLQGTTFGITNKMIFAAGGIGMLLLVCVHLFLLRVLLKNERRLEAEFDLSEPLLLAPLKPIDREMYTIRINSWNRTELLVSSILHHSTCPGVAQIQVVWCDEQGYPPETLAELGDKVVVEHHSENSLNERFNLMLEPATLGILSMDDDVLRPCEAIDSGFRKWTHNPERMVGFDARSHVVDEHKKWSYGYMSTTEKANHYSMTLPRYAFLHADYLKGYMTKLPRSIFNTVEEHFNCEDIAMSFYISSQTGGKPPLLADFWAMRGLMVKLYSQKTISGTHDHKKTRDDCVDVFAEQLGLKNKLVPAVFNQGGLFDCGAEGNLVDKETWATSERVAAFEEQLVVWKAMETETFINDVMRPMKTAALKNPFIDGLIEDTDPWRRRWQDGEYI